MKFTDEYKDYVRQFGAISYFGHELVGVSTFPRLNVVDVTEYERKMNPWIPPDYYVIEQAHIDDIVVWQAGNGTVYQTWQDGTLIKLENSLADYITGDVQKDEDFNH